MAKVTETVKRLLALEKGLGEVRAEVAGVGVTLGEVRHEVHELRADFKAGVGQLVAGLESLEKAIDRVAEIRPRIDALERRVDRLEEHRA